MLYIASYLFSLTNRREIVFWNLSTTVTVLPTYLQTKNKLAQKTGPTIKLKILGTEQKGKKRSTLTFLRNPIPRLGYVGKQPHG